MGTNAELFYFWKQKKSNVISFLKQSKIKALVLPEEKDWVAVLPENEFGHPPITLLKNYTGILVQLYFHDEFGWGMNIYDKDICLSSYQCLWHQELTITNHLFPEVLTKIFGNSFADLKSKKNKQIFEPSKPEIMKMFPDWPANLFAKEAHLPLSDSPVFLSLDYKSLKEDAKARKIVVPEAVVVS